MPVFHRAWAQSKRAQQCWLPRACDPVLNWDKTMSCPGRDLTESGPPGGPRGLCQAPQSSCLKGSYINSLAVRMRPTRKLQTSGQTLTSANSGPNHTTNQYYRGSMISRRMKEPDTGRFNDSDKWPS